MPITLLDGILLVIMFLSAILAMIRGFVREVLSIASWIAAAASAYFFYKPVKPFLADYISNDTVATVAAVAVVFLLTLFIVSYITMRISDFVLDSRVGALDRTLGFVFGAARGFLIVVVAMLFFNWFVPEQQQPQWIMNAKSRHLLVTTGASLVAALPEDPEEAIMDQIRRPAAEGQSNAAGDAEAPTYSSSERRSLDQLSETGTARN
ncbi:CvpA family protein [Pseudovibrio exalbescens]|uniref:Colicin V synthesis protein n=1 Tax=Pseudovibrio exalbescens TaxID=197461 RepID=A0A1U7JE75_9HYPH|nr:CvpA family protein [Pseudovibrio exalbescens]OKL43005.1 colicin V synthesis protein [Pseudovibrio exalbescens]